MDDGAEVEADELMPDDAPYYADYTRDMEAERRLQRGWAVVFSCAQLAWYVAGFVAILRLMIGHLSWVSGGIVVLVAVAGWYGGRLFKRLSPVCPKCRGRMRREAPGRPDRNWVVCERCQIKAQLMIGFDCHKDDDDTDISAYPELPNAQDMVWKRWGAWAELPMVLLMFGLFGVGYVLLICAQPWVTAAILYAGWVVVMFLGWLAASQRPRCLKCRSRVSKYLAGANEMWWWACHRCRCKVLVDRRGD